MLPFNEPSEEQFLRELGFNPPGMAAKTTRKYFLKASQRFSITCFGSADRPDYILIEYNHGQGFRALRMTPDRYEVKERVRAWLHANRDRLALTA